MRRQGVQWWRSLRLPIAAIVVMSAMTVGLLFAVVADRSTMTDGIARLRAQAQDQLSAATATYEFTGALLDGVTVVDAHSRTDQIPASLLEAATGNPTVTWFDGADMWAANAISDSQVLVLQVSAAPLLTARHHLQRSLLLVGLVTLAIALLGGWTVASSLTSRLRRAARWVEVGATDANGAPRPGRDGDEVGELVAQIDLLSATLRDRVRTEQALTADMAHELRTPLTALVSAVELLPDDHSATGLVRRQVARLRVLVDELLELARADQDGGVESEPVDPVDLLASIVAQIPEIAPDAVRGDHARPVLADPRRLERVLVNLLANAHRHGARPVTVEVAEDRVIVRDSGPGFPAEVLTSGPQRLHAVGRTAGSGLGLALAQAYAEKMGASLSLSNERGAVATLTLPSGDLTHN